MPDTTMYHTASSDSGSAVDKRGHLFRFPSLGLPDPEGEWVIIRAAIGTRKNATSKLKNDSIEPPMRYAYQGCGSMDIEHDGAIWVVPLVAANHVSGDATEFFLLKSRRLPLSSKHKTVLTKLQKGQEICHVVHPRGLAEFEVSPQPTSSDDKAFWSMTLAALAREAKGVGRERHKVL